MWPDTRLLDLFGIELPIVQAPMAGATGAEMAVAVAKAGGLGSLPCAMLAAVCTLNDMVGWGGETQALIYHPQTKRIIGVNGLGIAREVLVL